MSKRLVIWALVVVAVLALGIWMYSLGNGNPPPPPPPGSPTPGASPTASHAPPVQVRIDRKCSPVPDATLNPDQLVHFVPNGYRMEVVQKGTDPGLAYFPEPGMRKDCDPTTKGKQSFTVDPATGYDTPCSLVALPSPTPGSQRWTYSVTLYPPGNPSATPTPICTIDPNICVRTCN